MKRSRSTALTILVCLVGCLPALAQTPGKFGLPAAKPTATAPALSTPALPVPTRQAAPTPTPAPAPGSAAAMNSNVFGQVKYIVVTMVAAKQGAIGKDGRIFPEKYQFQPGRYQDAATGKLVNGPVTFSKRWDANTMALLKALETNETLTSVTFEFQALNGTVLYTVKLTNASIVSINQTIDGVSAVPMEDIRLSYQKIEIQDNTTNPATQVASASY